MASVKIFYKGQDLAYYGPTPFLNLSTQVVKDSAERDILGFKTTISLEGKLWVPRKDPANKDDSNALSSNSLGIENLLKLEKHMRELFKEHGILKIQCNSTDLTFGLSESVTGNAITGSGVFCKVNSLNFSRTDDNWTRSIDYNIELEHYTKAGVKHPCAKHFPVVSYSDDWSVEPIDDPSYYLMNTQNNLRQLGNIFTQVYPVGNNRLENLIQYRITHRVSAVGAYAPTGVPAPGQAEGTTAPYHGGSPWVNAKQFVHCQVKRGNDQINHIFLSVDNSAANYPASFKNDASKYVSAPQTEAEPKAYLYNHSRLVNVSETAGSYEISDSWLAMSKPAGYTEQYSVELTQDVNNVVTARINGSIQGLELKKIDHNFGVELDIRDDHKTGKLILAHDPFVDGEDFENYLQNYSHNTLILNIKSERVELKCLILLEKYNINNYFFLDSSFPMINLLNKKFNNNNIASRYSEYECLEFTENIKDLITWIWIDCFTILPLNKEIFERIKLLNKKICIVSPELQGQPEKIEIYRQQLFDNNIIPEAICCKEYNIYEWI